MKLTQKFCNEPALKPGIYWDSRLPSFGLRVHAHQRTFILFTRDHDKKKKQIVIGHVDEMTLNDARNRAKLLKDKHTLPRSPTVSELCAVYIDDYAIPNKKTYNEDVRRIKQNILPTFAHQDAATLTLQQVKLWHKSLSVHPYEANRSLSLLSAIYNYAIRQGLIPPTILNPCLATKPNRERSRSRYLTKEEVQRLLTALPTIPLIPASAIHLLLLTGCRKNEILSLTWNQVHITPDDAYFTLAPEQTKNKQQRSVPLTPQAATILQSLPVLSKYVFPSPTNPTKPINCIKKPWAKLLRNAKLINVRIHDLRRTLGSLLVQAGISMPVIAATLGHSNTYCTHVYARVSIGNEREALEKFTEIIK